MVSFRLQRVWTAFRAFCVSIPLLTACGSEPSTEQRAASDGTVSGFAPDWSENATLPPEGHRANIYEVADPEEWRALVRTGTRHLMEYPVGPTGILVPERLVKEVLNWWIVQKATGLADIQEFYKWLGLNPYPATDETIPFPAGGVRPTDPMGVSKRVTEAGDVAMTFGCAACHTGQLFGRSVLGLSNRFPRANEAFVKVHDFTPFIQKAIIGSVTRATPGELAMLDHIKKVFPSVGVKKPAALGLDTSLAQVGLSLARREQDPYATQSKEAARRPRRSRLETFVADSKPAVWWNVKYKTRFLSDGSVVAGNPIYTNFLWNEIGRGADLHALEAWLQDNQSVVREITAAAFAVEAPRYTDFFPAEKIDLARAQAGEKLFIQHCSRCHGQYEKAWSTAEADGMPAADRLATTKVHYHPRTPVIDVGTDSQRAQGMEDFAARLNELAISRTIGTTVVPQNGYVPPPLVGIWARWPYFHNNAVPSLCAVLTRGSERPALYHSGEAIDPERDFDQECNGYPIGDATPKAWKTKEHEFDARKPGLGNQGHDEGIFLKDGVELLSKDDKGAIIEFLKTL